MYIGLGSCVWIDFKPDKQMKRAGAGHPRVTTLEELKNIFVMYLKAEKPQLLEYKVEAFLQGRGNNMLGALPYCS